MIIMSNLPTRDEAWNILTKYVTTDHLQRHVLMVEGTMRHFARLFNEDEEYWGILGMLHDIDFELYPEEHLNHAPRILREEGFDDEFIHSVLSHGYGICSDTEPVTNAEKVLFTIDELDRACICLCINAAFKERYGSGAEIRQKEV